MRIVVYVYIYIDISKNIGSNNIYFINYNQAFKQFVRFIVIEFWSVTFVKTNV